MASWAAKRKATYLSVILGVLILLIGLPAFLLFYKAPSCVDGKQNQNELGVDCGGPCSRLCSDRDLPPIVNWQRIFRISDGLYSVLAYVENPNLNSGVLTAPYVFRIYDANGVAIAEREGVALIPPGAIVPVFEPLITTGERTALRSSFVFSEELSWSTFPDFVAPSIKIERQEMVSDGGLPRLNSVLRNESESKLSRFKVVAIVYGFDGNALDVSQTLIDSLLPEESSQISFTWRAPFSGDAAKIEIMPILYPGVNY